MLACSLALPVLDLSMIHIALRIIDCTKSKDSFEQRRTSWPSSTSLTFSWWLKSSYSTYSAAQSSTVDRKAINLQRFSVFFVKQNKPKLLKLTGENKFSNAENQISSKLLFDSQSIVVFQEHIITASVGFRNDDHEMNLCHWAPQIGLWHSSSTRAWEKTEIVD